MIATVRAMRRATKPEEVFDYLVTYACDRKFSHVTYLSLRLAEDGDTRLLLTTHDREAVAAYRGLAGRVSDPLVTQARQTTLPFIWAREDYAASPDDVRVAVEERARHQVFSGVVVPMRSHLGYSGMVHLASDASRAELEARAASKMPEIMWVCFNFANNLVRTYPDRGLPLSPFEQLCLSMLAGGASMAEIASQAGRSIRYVRWVLDNLRQRVGAVNVVHLVHIAHERGFL